VTDYQFPQLLILLNPVI